MSEFRRVAIVPKMSSRDAIRTAHELAEWLERRELDVALDPAALRASPPRAKASGFDPTADYDLVVVLGGDGTLLSIARTLGDRVPILGVNLGTLGFLTEVGRGELYPALVRVLAGEYRIERRALLDVQLERANGGKLAYRVLNDAVISKGALARIIELVLHVDGSLVARFRADGLIASTPTGSTAYNLSASGPILHPRLPVAVLTPICPHTLSLRPIVVPDDADISVTLHTPREEVYLSLDGQEGTTLEYRDRVRIRRSPVEAQLIKITDRSFYDSLRGKLRWGGLNRGSRDTESSKE